MSAAGGGSAFSVACPRAVLNELRELIEHHRGTSIGPRIVAALTAVNQRLQESARECGEPLFRLQSLHLVVRMFIVPPLVVDYSVHEEQSVVFVRRILLLSDPV